MTIVYFGYDCASAAGSAYQAVVNRYGKPDFVGRYLWEIAGTSTGLTRPEMGWCHAVGMGVLLIDNGVPQGSVGGSYADGHAAGSRAAAQAKALGAPAGVAIVLDIEAPTFPSGEYMRGYLDAIHAAGYVGGFYLNGIQDSHVQPYLWARANSAAPAVVYSSEPEFTAWWDERKPDWYDFTQTPLAPRAADVGFHQYGENELGGAADLDGANDYGYRLLWHKTPPAPPAQPRYHVADRCALKQDHTHTSEVAIDPARKEVYLEAGADVVPTGTTFTDAAGELWWEVRLTRGEAVVHGWLPKGVIVEGA